MPSVTRSYSQALRQAAQRLALSLPPENDNGSRVSLAEQDQLWQALVAQSADPLVGLQLGQQLQVGHLDVAGMLLISCETYGESLDMLVEYHPIVGEGGEFLLDSNARPAKLVYHPQITLCRAQRVEAVAAAMIHLSQWSTGGQFQASEVQFAHQPLDEQSRYEALLGCPVSFGQQQNALLFDPALLSAPLIQANPSLREQLRALADERLRGMDDAGIAGQVVALLREHPDWSKEQVGRALAMSERNLTRVLAEEGLGYRHLREEILREHAEKRLAQSDEKVIAIALDLGFSDERAFAKAFRRWTGLTPTQFREGRATTD